MGACIASVIQLCLNCAWSQLPAGLHTLALSSNAKSTHALAATGSARTILCFFKEVHVGMCALLYALLEVCNGYSSLTHVDADSNICRQWEAPWHPQLPCNAMHTPPLQGVAASFVSTHRIAVSLLPGPRGSGRN